MARIYKAGIAIKPEIKTHFALEDELFETITPPPISSASQRIVSGKAKSVSSMMTPSLSHYSSTSGSFDLVKASF